jgi:alkylation response protein AidB-like acyl-CoA dehydrogenase
VNLEPTDEQRELRDTVHRFLAAKASVAEHVRPLLDDPTGMTGTVWRGLVDIGTTGLLVPTQSGGAGMSMVEAGAVCEELGAALHPGPWLSSAVTAPRAVSHFDAGDANGLLSGLADGSTIATVALPAPDERPLTVGRRGDAVVVDGALEDVPDAAAADTLLVLVAEGEQITLLETPTSAVRLTQQPGIDQTRKQFRVEFDASPARILGAAGASAAETLIDDILIASAADALGAARQLLMSTFEYTMVRNQLGHPIGSFQAVAHLCVDMHETVELATSGVMYALWAADNADRRERHLAALRVKAFSGRLASVGDQAIQVLGGIGYTWEHDAHLYLKRLMSFCRLLGSPGAYQEMVGREMAGTTS